MAWRPKTRVPAEEKDQVLMAIGECGVGKETKNPGYHRW